MIRDVSPHTYVVSGEAIERFTSMTNWTYYEALRRFQRVLDRAGVSDALREAGIQEGDDVRIGSEFVYHRHLVNCRLIRESRVFME
jgi:Obg family GTPase CgtA-like protein